MKTAPVAALRRAVEAAPVAALRLAVEDAPVTVLALLSPLPLIHGPGEQAMGVRRPGCASAVPLNRIAERTPAGPTPTNQ
jgi:hypothetical protein